MPVLIFCSNDAFSSNLQSCKGKKEKHKVLDTNCRDEEDNTCGDIGNTVTRREGDTTFARTSVSGGDEFIVMNLQQNGLSIEDDRKWKEKASSDDKLKMSVSTNTIEDGNTCPSCVPGEVLI